MKLLFEFVWCQVCALLGMDLTVYMGEVDTQRQELNVFRMELLGAKVVDI